MCGILFDMIQSKAAIEIDKIKKLLISKYQPQKIILFGSFAWGKPGKDSDLDIFIIKKVNKPRPAREQDVYRLLMRHFSDRKLPVDIIVHTPQETDERFLLGDPFIKEVINSGKVIYDRVK